MCSLSRRHRCGSAPNLAHRLAMATGLLTTVGVRSSYSVFVVSRRYRFSRHAFVGAVPGHDWRKHWTLVLSNNLFHAWTKFFVCVSRYLKSRSTPLHVISQFPVAQDRTRSRDAEMRLRRCGNAMDTSRFFCARHVEWLLSVIMPVQSTRDARCGFHSPHGYMDTLPRAACPQLSIFHLLMPEHGTCLF